jgi:riboflavin synthase
MFTGLVQDVGTVAAREGCRLTIATALPGLALGDSVACAGCCLTVVEVGATFYRI